LDSERIETNSYSPENTQEIGRRLGAAARPGDVYLLVGELGTGKTCLTQGILWGLGAREYARSPTFVLVSEYKARLPLYHIDLYRVGSAGEALGLGIEEYLEAGGLCVVEWADRVPELFSGNHLSVRMERRSDTTRRLTISSSGPDYREVLSALRPALTGH
jgi:tRNA threonylcarbamoyladenosine biosynthesis protein TsaE